MHTSFIGGCEVSIDVQLKSCPATFSFNLLQFCDVFDQLAEEGNCVKTS